MRKFLRLTALLAIGAASLSACDVSLSADAAQVNGQQIGQKTLNDTLTGVAKTPAVACVMTGAGSSALAGVGGKSTYSTSIAAALLTTLVDAKLFVSTAKQMGLALTPLSEQLAVQESASELAPASGSACTASGAKVLADLPVEFRNAFIELTAARAAIGAHLAKVALTSAGMSSYAAAHQSTRLDCVSAIVVPTKAAALAMASAARAGASFAALARAHSSDSSSASNGGAVGCVEPAQFTPPLSSVVAGLSVGEISAPVSFNSSYVILLVTSRKAASALDVAADVEQAVSTKLNTALNLDLDKANVEIDPNYGTWKKSAGSWQVVAPVGPPAKWVDNLPAVTPTTFPAVSSG